MYSTCIFYIRAQNAETVYKQISCSPRQSGLFSSFGLWSRKRTTTPEAKVTFSSSRFLFYHVIHFTSIKRPGRDVGSLLYDLKWIISLLYIIMLHSVQDFSILLNRIFSNRFVRYTGGKKKKHFHHKSYVHTIGWKMKKICMRKRWS